jgi:PleD family two-component response regulator
MTMETPSSRSPATRTDPVAGEGGAKALGSPILVVEDDQTTCDVVRAYLESAGHRVVV